MPAILGAGRLLGKLSPSGVAPYFAWPMVVEVNPCQLSPSPGLKCVEVLNFACEIRWCNVFVIVLWDISLCQDTWILQTSCL